MKRYSSTAHLAIAALVLLIFAGPVTAAEEVPFRGSLDGVITNTPLEFPMLFVDIAGTGNATLLGGFTVEIPHLVDRSNSTAVGTFLFTAANGDTLTADFTGQGSPTSTPGVASIVETATITGGTGRFAGATGSFTLTRLYNMAAGVTTGSFSGIISSPGARKQ